MHRRYRTFPASPPTRYECARARPRSRAAGLRRARAGDVERDFVVQEDRNLPDIANMAVSGTALSDIKTVVWESGYGTCGLGLSMDDVKRSNGNQTVTSRGSGELHS